MTYKRKVHITTPAYRNGSALPCGLPRSRKTAASDLLVTDDPSKSTCHHCRAWVDWMVRRGYVWDVEQKKFVRESDEISLW